MIREGRIGRGEEGSGGDARLVYVKAENSRGGEYRIVVG